MRDEIARALEAVIRARSMVENAATSKNAHPRDTLALRFLLSASWSLKAAEFACHDAMNQILGTIGAPPSPPGGGLSKVGGG